MKKVFLINIFLCCAHLMMAQCIDMLTPLQGRSDVTCTYGTMVEFTDGTVIGSPYDNVGVIDYGSSSEYSRHTIHTSTYETDHMIPMLKTIPPGETSSIRIGNWLIGAEAESITFEYTVTAANPLLLLKYAGVMENPGHSSFEQPRLKLDVMDSQGSLIDSVCNCFDFIAASNLGWNNYYGVLWKDWTNIGVNLVSHIGEKVKVRLTSYDCLQQGHFGYAYIHLSCATQEIQETACGEDVVLEAPDGYEYKWYKTQGGKHTLVGNKQSITVPRDGALYECDCAQIGKPSCYFTISATASATPRYPIADFSVYKINSCADTLYLTNTSGISTNGTTIDLPIVPCDSAVWILDDGRQFNSYDISDKPIVFANSGKHTITLMTFLRKGQCYSSTSKTIYVHGSLDTHTYTTYAEICEGDIFTFANRKLTTSGTYYDTIRTWYNCDSISILKLTVHPSYEFFDTIHLCDGDAYDYHGQRITSSGSYTVPFHTKYGCDSIYHAYIIRERSYNIEEEVTICQGEVFDFNGMLLRNPGVYWDSARTQYGCDSIVKLTLHVNPSYLLTTKVESCEDETFDFRGRRITTPGIYYDSLLTHLGCDSIYQLVYVKTPTYHFESTEDIIEGETYHWQGKNLRTSGTYFAHYKTISGCDSTYKLMLTVHPRFDFAEEYTICDNEDFVWRGHRFTKSGVYYDSLQTIFGSDSIFQLILHVLPTYEKTMFVNICHDQTFDFRGKTLSAPGIYYDSLLTHLGCDSVYKLVFITSPIYFFEDYDTIFAGATYDFHGRIIRDAGVYWDSLKTDMGCDSIYKLNLFVKQHYHFDEVATICSNHPYLWRGNLYDSTGIYVDAFKSIAGTDSIYTLNLTVNPAYFSSNFINLCYNDSFTINNHKFQVGEEYYDTIRSSCNCDSVTRYIFVQSPTYLFEEYSEICPGERYNFRGNNVFREGIYWDSLKTVNGCDSIYKLYLSVKERYLFDTLVVHDCMLTPYEWRGKFYNETGVYFDSLTTYKGCDSIYMLGLLAHHPFYEEFYDTICDAKSYIFHGQEYNETGIYYDSLTTKAGCDSVYALYLEVLRAYQDTIVDSICLGDTISFYTLRLSQNGFYADTIYNQYTNLCEVHNIILSVRPHADIYYVSIPDLCADDEIYQIFFRYRGERPYAYSLYYSPAAKQQGFADVLNHPYSDSIPIMDSIPQYPFDAYIYPDQYMVRLELNNGYCDPQKYGVDIPFVVRYPSWIIEQNWNNVVALLNEKYNGGYVFDKYEWYVNGRKVDYATGTNLYSQEIGIGDEVVLYPQRVGDNYSIPTCPIYIYDKIDQNPTPLFVYPTSVPISHAKVNVRAKGHGVCAVYNLLGNRILTNVSIADEVEIELPSITGWYMIYYQSDNGQKETQMILVY